MFALLSWDGGLTYDVIEKKDCKKIKDDSFVFRCAGSNYMAKVACFHDKKEALQEFAKYLNQEQPKVPVTRILEKNGSPRMHYPFDIVGEDIEINSNAETERSVISLQIDSTSINENSSEVITISENSCQFQSVSENIQINCEGKKENPKISSPEIHSQLEPVDESMEVNVNKRGNIHPSVDRQIDVVEEGVDVNLSGINTNADESRQSCSPSCHSETINNNIQINSDEKITSPEIDSQLGSEYEITEVIVDSKKNVIPGVDRQSDSVKDCIEIDLIEMNVGPDNSRESKSISENSEISNQLESADEITEVNITKENVDPEIVSQFKSTGESIEVNLNGERVSLEIFRQSPTEETPLNKEFYSSPEIIRQISSVGENINLELVESFIDQLDNSLNSNKSNVESMQIDQEIDNCSSDEDYLPSNHENDSDSESDNSHSSYTSKSKSQNTSTKSNSSYNISMEIPVDAPDDVNLDVEQSRGRSGSGKKHCCLYCKKLYFKLPRHLESVHGNEADVKKFKDLPVKNPERIKIIDTLRKHGDHLHNTKSSVNSGKLFVCRRPSSKVNRDATDFQPCPSCKGYYSTNTLRVHVRKCSGVVSNGSRCIKVMSRQVAGRIHHSACKLLRKYIFPVLREDAIVRLIRYDELVIAYGNKMCDKYGSQQHQHDMIRARIRILGRFLEELKKLNSEVKDMRSVFHPKFYDDTKQAIRNLAGYDENKRRYNTPTIVTSLFSLLKTLGGRLVTLTIQLSQREEQTNVENFLKVLTEDYGASMNKTAIETTTEIRKSNKQKLELPSQEDIRKLCNYLQNKMQSLFDNLCQSFNFEDWLALLEVVLTSLQLFNRRRSGEIERITIADYQNKKCLTETDSKLTTLPKHCLKLAKMYSRMEISGKLNRSVPVLVRCDIEKCINLLIKLREKAGVLPENKFVFGLPGLNKNRHKYLRACELLRRFSNDCGAKNPLSLRGTQLRKHIATVCTGLKLAENDVLALADFMGHDKEIHKKIYRQPTIQKDIVDMSKLLLVAQGTDLIVEESETESEGELDQPDVEQENSSGECVAANNSEFNLEREVENEELRKLNKRKRSDPELAVSEGSKNTKKKRSTSPNGSVKRTPWSEGEKKLVLQKFGYCIKEKNLPSSNLIESVRHKNPSLNNRTAAQIKSWLNNQQRKFRSQLLNC